MSKYSDSARLSPDKRLLEVATFLAAGILRLAQNAALPADNSPKKPVESSPQALEVPAKTRLSVRVG